jgi:tRNA pseudouridine synthase 10
MNKFNNNHKIKIINNCIKNGIKLCEKCFLRFCDLKNFDYYKSDNNLELKKLINNELNEELNELMDKILSENCYSCLGLLTDNYINKLINDLINYLKSSKCEHSFKSFQLQVSIPVSITLRNQLLINKFKTHSNLLINNNSEEKFVDFSLIFSVKDIFRVILSDRLEKQLRKPFDSNSSFNIGLDFSHEESSNECQQFYELSPKTFFPKKCRKSMTKSFLNQSSILRALEVIDSQVLSDWTINETKVKCKLESIQLSHSSIYIAGRYLKFSRNLSQTPWILDGERLMESSVQDLIIDQIKKFVKCDDIKFSSSGREDVDVRMLGRGRPFILEVLNPRIIDIDSKQFSSMRSAINESQNDVAVRDLQIVSKNSLQTDLKEGESEKTKTYQALCCISRPLTDSDIELLDNTKDLLIRQKTPIRVLHRRTLSVRERLIYRLWAERVNESDVCDQFKDSIDRIFKLNLITQSGTYIKEFVHSDFGRTEPHLADILGNCRADILQLDVMVF